MAMKDAGLRILQDEARSKTGGLSRRQMAGRWLRHGRRRTRGRASPKLIR